MESSLFMYVNDKSPIHLIILLKLPTEQSYWNYFQVTLREWFRFFFLLFQNNPCYTATGSLLYGLENDIENFEREVKYERKGKGRAINQVVPYNITRQIGLDEFFLNQTNPSSFFYKLGIKKYVQWLIVSRKRRSTTNCFQKSYSKSDSILSVVNTQFLRVETQHPCSCRKNQIVLWFMLIILLVLVLILLPCTTPLTVIQIIPELQFIGAHWQSTGLFFSSRYRYYDKTHLVHFLFFFFFFMC